MGLLLLTYFHICAPEGGFHYPLSTIHYPLSTIHYVLSRVQVHYLGNDTEVVFSSSLPGFAALKLFPTLLRLQYRHKKVGYFMVFQTPKVDFTVSFATLPLASDYYRKKIPYACQTKNKHQCFTNSVTKANRTNQPIIIIQSRIKLEYASS